MKKSSIVRRKRLRNGLYEDVYLKAQRQLKRGMKRLTYKGTYWNSKSDWT